MDPLMRPTLFLGVAILAIPCAMSNAAQPTPLTDAKIVRTASVAADRDTTWKAWTSADELKKWFGRDALVELTPGGPYEIYFLMDQPPGLRGGEGNKVETFLPGRMLAFTWNAPPMFGPSRDFRTHVVLEFADHPGGGTDVTLSHYGWPAGEDFAKIREYFENAWTRVMAGLTEHLGAAKPAAANDRRIDYVEFVAPDLLKAKAFYNSAFGWEFADYGSGYAAFNDGRLSGGFEAGEAPVSRGALVILYAVDLEATEARIVGAGGTITERLDFPGGRRFHFKDTNGLELAVWTDRAKDGSKIE